MKIFSLIFFAILLNNTFSWSQISNKAQAISLVNQGIVSFNNGDYVTALSKYDKALSLDAVQLDALYEKTIVLTRLDRYDESVALCHYLIQKFPCSEQAKVTINNLGTYYYVLKKLDQSIEIYQFGISYYPDYFLYHYALAVVYVAKKAKC